MMNQTRLGWCLRFAATWCATLFIAGAAGIAAPAAEVPVIDGGLGPCSANFTVTDSSKKPIYNAKIDVVIHYGFMSLRKSELQIGTNSDGKARVIGLPDRLKKPLEFHIDNGVVSKTVLDDPDNPARKCNATFEVTLGVD
jgi:hypothetical protein